MSEIDRIMTEIERELEIFQWSYGVNRSDNRGEISVDRENRRLILEVWTADNESAEDYTIKPLHVSVDVGTFYSPREQIRRLIHLYLCHEADEQIWFGEERPYYPH
jgi:hypothetical protein